jgi:hypothetical protein
MERSLSKSKYLAGMQCIKRLWLQVYEPEKAPPPSPVQQRIFDQGTEVGELARNCYPSGQLIPADYYETAAALKQTEDALQKGITDLFEPCFVFAATIVRVDILHNNGDESFDIIEVKSTTGVHTEHIWDLAVQNYVLEGSGLAIRSACLMHLNTECRYPQLSNLFSVSDLTEEVRTHLKILPENLQRFHAVLDSATEPAIPVGSHCFKPYDCPFRFFCFSKAKLPSLSIFNIPRLAAAKLDSLASASRFRLEDIPDDFPLSKTQQDFIDLCRSKRRRIDRPAINKFLASLVYPLFFLDFETDNPAVPQFDGLGPYQKFPFQFSLHILHEDGSLDHTDFLETNDTDPRKPLTEALLSAIGPSGSIIAYNAAFEKSVIRSLAVAVPETAGRILELIPRFKDLLDIFRSHYIDPAFGGSNSIKAVLPVLCPGISYEDLDIKDGTSAQISRLRLIESADTDEKAELAEQLKDYCRMDTLAMVRIYNALQKQTNKR